LKPFGCDGDSTAPSAPTHLTSSLVTTTSLRLSWTVANDSTATDSFGVTKYHIFRNGVYVATVNALTTTFSMRGFVANTTYTFTVRADDVGQNRSPNSDALTGDDAAVENS
jgi:hypothetical protein